MSCTRPGTAARIWRSTCIAVLVLGVCVSTSAAESGGDAFEAATAAFNADDFARALELFERARSAGASGPALEYNVAVSRYKLGDYAAAEAAFEALAGAYPQFRSVAQYNRGLALLAQERHAEARRAFEAASSSDEPQIAALAARALESLGVTSVPAAARSRWSGFADFTAGYDDNVALADELPGFPASSSAFADVYGYARRSLGTRVPSRLEITGYTTRQPEADAFDQDAVRVGYVLRRTVGAWRFDAGPHLSYATLGGDGFERQIGVGLQATRGINAQTALDVRFNHDDIADLSPQFSFIDGSRESLRLTWDRRGATARLRLSYAIERNDRAGAASSADRNRATVRVTRPLAAAWQVDAWGSYRKTQRGRLAEPVDESLLEWSVTANREITANWLLQLGYYGADNDSDVPVYAYDRNRMTIGLSKEF